MEIATKHEKLSFRTTKENADAIKRAANINRISYSDFMNKACLEKAFKVFEEKK